MLKTLKISNYILIDDLIINFSNGLNIFTGETGSGKSVIINSLKFLIVSSKDSTILLDATKPCFVEATFSINSCSEVQDYIKLKTDLDIDTKNIALRKELNSSLKSLYYINNVKVPFVLFKYIVDYFLDFHLQNETFGYVSNTMNRCRILDAYGGINNLVDDHYSGLFKKYKDYKQQICSLKDSLTNADIDKDYIEYQLAEFTKIDLSLDLKDKLEQEYKILSNKKLSQELIVETIGLIEDDTGVLAYLKRILKNLANIKINHVDNLANRIDNIYIELIDCKDELKSNLHNLESLSDDNIDSIKSKLDLIYSLEQKYKVISIEQLIKKKEELEAKLNSIDTIESRLGSLQNLLIKTQEDLVILATEITDLRLKAARMLENNVSEFLPFVGMQEARFTAEVLNVGFDRMNNLGCNEVIFNFSAVSDAKIDQLTKVASGGELARLVLILKGIIASKNTYAKTLILDEVDTGISGAIAMKTGKLIEKFSENMQIIIVTHLPQVASRKGAHYMVYKRDLNSIGIKLLNDNKDRVSHIASMISGQENISSSALQHAQELIIQ
ncbi:MAG: DNA repair protein RecN [Solitalea-like symbiont of Acarus siro]